MYFGVLETAYQETNQWYKDGVKLLKNNLQLEPNKMTAKNTILFMGDGTGITTATAARILEGQMRGGSGEENVLSWEKFPWSAQAKTYNVNSQGADSGACATAYLCGVKTNQGRDKRHFIHRVLSDFKSNVAALKMQFVTINWTGALRCLDTDFSGPYRAFSNSFSPVFP